MPTVEPTPTPTDATRREAEAKRPEGKEIEELNRQTMPKTPDGEVVDPKQEEAKNSAG
jgi:hypothetical protein